MLKTAHRVQQDHFQARKDAGEINVNLHTTNVTCFNIGNSQVTNSHEIKIDPKKFLQNAPTALKQQ